jgi:hypothetical protein
VSWVTFPSAGGGLVVVQLRHIVAIYDEQGEVKLATTSGGVHILKETTVQRAAALVSNAEDASFVHAEQMSQGIHQPSDAGQPVLWHGK